MTTNQSNKIEVFQILQEDDEFEEFDDCGKKFLNISINSHLT